MKVGLVGLGRMGRAMYARLTESGHEVTAWDRAEGAMKSAGEHQVRLADSPRAIAAFGEAVISTITEDNGVRAIVGGADGYLSGDVKGKLFIDMSTLRPATGRELAPVVAAAGARLVDAPVFGTIPHVKSGKLFAMVGGTAEDFERAKPVLSALAHKIVHMGPNGSGYAMKLAVNLGLAAFVQATAESLALGTREGLKLEQMLDILVEGPVANGWLTAKKGALNGEPADITLDLKTMRKDIMSMVATGTVDGMPMPLSSGMLAAFSAAVASGWGDRDIGDLPKFFREHMGQKFE
jgi:3-hydroxyisobutyrate dehydrogenase